MYMKPSMQVVELRRHQPLLSGSDTGGDQGADESGDPQ